MSGLAWSDTIWAGWLILFLALEIPAALGVTPWVSLSQTSWLNEHEYPILRTLLFGFLLGLGVHIRFGTGLWRTTVGGILVAVVLNYLWTVKQ